MNSCDHLPRNPIGCSGTLVKPLVRIEQCNLAIGQNALTTIILVALNIPIVSGSDAATRITIVVNTYTIAKLRPFSTNNLTATAILQIVVRMVAEPRHIVIA